MKISKLALPLTCLLVPSVLSAAEMHIPMSFEYLALDGRKISRSMVVHKSELELTPGYHEIAIRYNDMVELDMPDTPESVASSAFIITLNVPGDVDYYLEPAGGDGIRNPLEFAEAPDVVVTRKDGGPVDYQLTHTDIGPREFETRLYGKTLSPEAQEQARAAAAAAAAAAASTQLVPEASAAAPAPVAAATLSSAPSASAGTMGETDEAAATAVTADTQAVTSGEHTATPGEMLQLWWQRADEQTRKEFLSWAIKQL